MWVIWVGWLYVVLMMAVAQNNLVRSVLILVGLGIFPTALMLWIQVRKLRQRADAEADIPPRNEGEGEC